MALVLEDGTLVANSNSYQDVAGADAYFTLIGQLDWIGSTAAKEQALIQASQAVDLLYGQRYMSVPQATFDLNSHNLLFPRMGLVVNRVQLVAANTIPEQLKRAVAEVALMKLQGTDIFPIINTDNYLTSKEVAISGGPSKKLAWSKNPHTETYKGFNKIELLLAPLLKKENGSATRFVL